MPLSSYSDKFQLSAFRQLKVPQVHFITVVHASLFIQRQVPAFCAQTAKVPQVRHGGSCLSVHTATSLAVCVSDSKGATGAMHHGGSCISVHTATSSSCLRSDS